MNNPSTLVRGGPTDKAGPRLVVRKQWAIR